MMSFFRRRREPPAHRDVFAEFAMQLLGLLMERRLAAGREPRPRLRAVR